jgi:pimeloyl-ACP methyl ester carboxylesterase
MAEDAKANPPLVRGDVALRDIDAVVDFIRKRRNVARVNDRPFLGHRAMATYATQHPDKVERVVLYAAVWIRTTPSPIRTGAGPLGAYREVTVEQTRARRFTGIPEHKKAEIFPPGWFEAWAQATWATDPVGAAKNPPVLRAPNGSVQDSLEYWWRVAVLGRRMRAGAAGARRMGQRHGTCRRRCFRCSTVARRAKRYIEAGGGRCTFSTRRRTG